MVGTSVWDYVFIRGCIICLKLVTPLSGLYTIATLLTHLPYRVPRALEVWFAIETVFYLTVYLPRTVYLQTAAKHPATVSRENRRKLFKRCHDSIPDPNRYVSKWFLDAPAAEIKRENVKEFFRWAFLNSADPDPAHDDELEEYASEMEKMVGRKLEPGRGSAKCLRLSLDKVEMDLHRSLTWYLCVAVVDTLTFLYMKFHYFNFYRASVGRFFTVFPFRPLTLASNCSPSKTLTYWHRPHTSKTRLPILFIHGIGVGLYPYVDFLADLNAEDDKDTSDGQVGIIAVEILPISSRITAEAMLKDEMCAEVDTILRAHGWDKVVLVTHSYGSVVAAHLLHTRRIAQRIGPLLFIDPVSFLLHHPDVAYNFVYRKPTRANEYQLSYFGSKDMGIAHTLFRRFFWADNIMWKEDIQGHRATVVLSGKDAIVDTQTVGAYLIGSDDWIAKAGGREERITKGGELDVLWFRDLDHGQVFDRPVTRGKLTSIVRSYIQLL